MTLQEFTKGMSILITEVGENAYQAEILGITPQGEMVDATLMLTECTDKQMVMDTLQSSLEDLYNIRYSYETSDEVDDTLLYDGGSFK